MEERDVGQVPAGAAGAVAAAGADGEPYQPYTNLPAAMQGLYRPKPPGKLKQALLVWAFGKGIPGIFGLLRTVAPIFHIPFTNTVILTRFDDVQEVYCRNEDFFVPYIKTSDDLKWDPAFLLALKHDDAHYRDMLRKVRLLWSDGDLELISSIAARVSSKALKANKGEIDAIQNLMLPVVLHVIDEYYGIPVPGLAVHDQLGNGERKPSDLSAEEKHDIERMEAFIAGSVSMASFLFGPQNHKEKQKQDIHWACNSVWPLVYDAVNNYQRDPGENTIIGRARRLRALNEADGGVQITDKELRSYLLGMIVGFLPTNTNANGRCFDVLMKRPEARRAAQEAVDSKDDKRLLGIIYEAMRLQYILPGLWREMEKPQSIRIGTTKPRKLDPKRLLYISGMAAMLDKRRIPNPKQFVPDRSRDVYMIYGHRFHYCVGAHLSDKMILGMFKALFSHRAQFKKGHKLEYRGNMPWNLVITYQAET